MVVDGGYSGNSLRQALAFQELGLRMHDRLVIDTNAMGAWAEQRYMQTWAFCWVFSKGKPRTFNPICDVKTRHPHMKENMDRTMGRNNKGIKTQRSPNIRYRNTIRRRGSIWRYTVGGKGAHMLHQIDGHSAQMPMAQAQDLIRSYSDEGDLVLDPFSGSGTTARAAQLLRRRAIGIEIHRPYIDAAIEARFAQGVML